MIEKRFEVVMNEFDEVEYIMDKVAMEDRDFAEFIDFVEDVCNENEQLKSKLFDCNLELDHSKETTDDAYYELTQLKKENEQLKERIKELEKNTFLCLDCEYCRNVEIGCLCNHNDDWVEFVTECDDFKKELYE